MKKNHTHYQNAQISPPNDVVITKTRIKAEIVFGSPSTGCKGSGVCMVVPYTAMNKVLKCPHATAWISITNQQMLRFSFIKSSMTEQQIKGYFRWNLFQVFEPLSMPHFVQSRIGVYRPLIIKSGIYFVEDRGHELKVDFHLID